MAYGYFVKFSWKPTFLELNNQYGHPKVDGPEAMRRVKACEAAVFLLCEVDGKVVGLVRGVYDGSRVLHSPSICSPKSIKVEASEQRWLMK